MLMEIKKLAKIMWMWMGILLGYKYLTYKHCYNILQICHAFYNQYIPAIGNLGLTLLTYCSKHWFCEQPG